MELTSDYPFWSIRNGLPKDYPSLDRDLSCDVVIVGGGITGALVAHNLTRAGAKTVLLDRRDIGTGSTSGCTALVQYEVDVPLRQLIKRIGRPKANRSYELCYEAVNGLAQLVKKLNVHCGFERKPSLFLAREAKEIPAFAEEFRLRRQLGFDLEFWEHDSIEHHFPFSRPAALFSRNAAQLDPHRLPHGLLAAAAQHGLSVFDRTAVTALLPTRQGIELLTENGYRVKARRAVIAAGFESKKFLHDEAGSLRSTFALISEPMPDWCGWYQRSLIWESGSPYLYLRTTPDNRIIVGGEDVTIVNPKKRDAMLGRKTKTLVAKFHQLFPQTKLEVAYSWAGTFAGTKDGLAYIGANRSVPHAYFALGYGGNGITYSFIAAQIIGDDFLGRRNKDAAIFKFQR